MFTTIKNTVITHFFNKKIKRYGTMLNLNLDSKNKSINLDVLLVGEESPLEINIADYKIVEENGKFFLQIDNVTTSRQWLNVLAEQTLNGEKIELPSKIAKLLKVVV